MKVRHSNVARAVPAAALLLLVVACGGVGGGSAQSEFAAACEASGNLDAKICECVAELASKELTPDALQFLIAGLAGDQERVAELRGGLGVEEAMQAGMFMVGAPGKCAGQLSGAR